MTDTPNDGEDGSDDNDGPTRATSSDQEDTPLVSTTPTTVQKSVLEK